jgi:hypothetical protein
MLSLWKIGLRSCRLATGMEPGIMHLMVGLHAYAIWALLGLQEFPLT